jgi:flavin reductase (DIM6/NTAB) family NADH-FMN oxidoreductase RutF
MTVSSDDLRQWMRHWASGVTLVTAQDGRGPHGMTVSSFTSLSLDPPLIMVSLEQGTRTHQMVRQEGRFAVVILRADQEDLAERFSSGIPDHEPRFDGVPHHRSAGGADPRRGSPTWIVEWSTPHRRNARSSWARDRRGSTGAGSPLIYFNRTYRRLPGEA